MSKVKLISDSTCDMPKELLKQYGVSIIPLSIVLGEKPYKDGIEVVPEDIFEWVDENGITPKTSAPSIVDAVEVLKPYFDEGYEVIYMGISSKMSTTLNVIKIAAAELDAEDRLHAIDAKNLSTGISILLCKAAKMIEKGMETSDIVKTLEEYVPKIRSSFVINSVLYLHKGGRCSAATALFASALNIKPMIVVTDGAMDSDKKYRGKMNSVVDKYLSDVMPKLEAADDEFVFITYSKIEEDKLEQIREKIEGLNRFKNIYMAQAGGVISSHCGPGAFAVMYMDK
ncbi:MAG: DegV family protein [Lachnospiraceae bacterium]|nr:DegV family protein [Lachnospiraceae bacterium]